MKSCSLINRWHLQALTALPSGCVLAGRFLLLLTTLLLALAPLSEYYCQWDRFLHGGQDVELGLITLVAFLGCVLVLAQHCKQSLTHFLAALRLLSQSFSQRATTTLSSLHRFASHLLACHYGRPRASMWLPCPGMTTCLTSSLTHCSLPLRF